MSDREQDQVSRVVEAWHREGIRYRRVIMRDGSTVIQRAENGRYVEHHRRET